MLGRNLPNITEIDKGAKFNQIDYSVDIDRKLGSSRKRRVLTLFSSRAVPFRIVLLPKT